MEIIRVSECILCKNTQKPLFRFPEDQDRLQKWLDNLKVRQLYIEDKEYFKNHARVCAAHFKENDFTSILKNRLKRVGVIPKPPSISAPSPIVNEDPSTQKQCTSSFACPNYHTPLQQEVSQSAQSSSFNSSLQSGHFIVHAPSSTTLPSGHILIQASTPVLPISTSILPDQSPNSSAQTPILTDIGTVQTAASIKQEMFEIGEIETEPPLDDHLGNIRRCEEFIKKGKKRIRKTEFDGLADIEERKMALLEEQLRIKRDHLKFQEKKTLILEQQLAISQEQLKASKEQLAISQEQLTVSKEQLTIFKQILQFKINKGS